MSCGDPDQHPVDNTQLGRELAKLEATDPAVAAAARKLDDFVRAGGYEPEIHACDGHVWLPEDRTPPGGGSVDLRRKGWYEMYVCRECRAVQCDRHEGAERCQEHRHHTGFHVFPSGRQVMVGE